MLVAGPAQARFRLPRLALPGRVRPGSDLTNASVRSALAVVAALPRGLRRDLAVVTTAPAGTDITLYFAGGPSVVWGDAQRVAAKTLALRTVLARYASAHRTATMIDVSVPDRTLAKPLLN